MIYCHLSSISHRSWDTASRSRSKTTPPQFEPTDRGELLWISSSNLADKKLTHSATFQWKLHDPNFSRFVTIHLRCRQTYRQHLMTIAEFAIQLRRSAQTPETSTSVFLTPKLITVGINIEYEYDRSLIPVICFYNFQFDLFLAERCNFIAM